MSSSRVVYSSQLFSIWSRLVQTPRELLCTPLSSRSSTNQLRARRVHRSPQDPVWITHCQLWHISRGRLGPLHTRPVSFTRKELSSRPVHLRCPGLPVCVLSDGHLLLLRPHDACVAVGLEPRGKTWRPVKMLFELSLFGAAHSGDLLSTVLLCI